MPIRPEPGDEELYVHCFGCCASFMQIPPPKRRIRCLGTRLGCVMEAACEFSTISFPLAPGTCDFVPVFHTRLSRSRKPLSEVVDATMYKSNVTTCCVMASNASDDHAPILTLIHSVFYISFRNTQLRWRRRTSRANDISPYLTGE